jgi:dCMP deaminase
MCDKCIKWDVRFLRLSKEVATWSKDPSSKIAAIAVDDNRRILSTGYNGFPRGIEDSLERLLDRPTKYKYIIHAELNCILNATYTGVSLHGATLYTTGLPVCDKCALAVIQAGFKRVVMDYPRVIPDNWKEAFEFTKSVFDEAGIEYLHMPLEDCEVE